MKCPECGKEDAYCGFSQVECINPDCSNFSLKQQAEVKSQNYARQSDIKSIYDQVTWNTFVPPPGHSLAPKKTGVRVIVYTPTTSIRRIIGKYYPDIPKFVKIRGDGSIFAESSATSWVENCRIDYDRRVANGLYKKEETTE